MYAQKKYVDDECCLRIWKKSEDYPNGYYFHVWEHRVTDLNSINGFCSTKVSPVFSGMILAGKPFYNGQHPGNQAKVNDFMNNVLQNETYKSRFVFSLNSYPYFWEGAYMDESGSTCDKAMEYALGTGPESYLGKQIVVMRQRMKQVLDGGDGILWIGETGWSSPAADTLHTAVKNCTDWSSEKSFSMSYDNFAKWDLTVPGTKAPEHTFYFTLRDSTNFGMGERFGLIGGCKSSDCKLSPPGGINGSTSSSTPAPAPRLRLGKV